KEAVLEVGRYAEVLDGSKSLARVKDVPTGRYYDLSKDLTMKPRQTLVLEF
ncbi:MAG: cyclomaltodextrinase C-terminal domain-containing protein, partial [Prevotella sp.]|nr:cyclomaltodextrinase C-terminal domain-containing protein [Prevotella sp.]